MYIYESSHIIQICSGITCDKSAQWRALCKKITEVNSSCLHETVCSTSGGGNAAFNATPNPFLLNKKFKSNSLYTNKDTLTSVIFVKAHL